MKTNVIIKLQQPATHYYPEACGEVEYLKYPHRHLFYYEIEVPVTHDNRQVEILQFKQRLQEALKEIPSWNDLSCESIAKGIYAICINLCQVTPCKITVLEDNENGAVVYFD